MRLLCAFAAAVLGLSSRALAGGVTVQKQGLQVPNKYKSQRDAVQKIFTTSWDAYRCVEVMCRTCWAG